VNGYEHKNPKRKVDPAFMHADIHVKIQPTSRWGIDAVIGEGLVRTEERGLAVSTYVKEVVEPDIGSVRYFLSFREGQVLPSGDLQWTPRTTLASPEIAEVFDKDGNLVEHSFPWTVRDPRLTKALDRLAVRKHSGQLELRMLVAYYEPMPKGTKVLRTGRYFVTRFVGGPASSLDLGGDEAGVLPPQMVQPLLTAAAAK